MRHMRKISRGALQKRPVYGILVMLRMSGPPERGSL